MIVVKRIDNINELQHYGIKGQKWGVRRYQNEDGTLTDAGKKRQLKRLSGSGAVTIKKGTKLMRVSRKEESDASPNSKLYVNPDKTEHDKYKVMIGSTNILNTGKAYVHEYLANNDIVIPSVKTQTKIERGLVKDAGARKDLVDSLMKKGMTREQASRVAKPINRGMEYVKASPWLLLTPIAPTAPLAFVSQANVKSDAQIKAIRLTIGDADAKTLNKKFEQNLHDKGYNAYRDTNDRKLGIKKSIVITDPDKNTKMEVARILNKNEFGKAYADTKVASNKKILNDIDMEDLIKDGEKHYEKLKEAHVLSKYNKDKREDILKKHADELKY